jgi:hypothetical protein
MKFKSDIEVQAGLRDGGNDIGTAGQLLSSTGAVTNWIDQGGVVAGEADKAKSVILRVKNSTLSAMTKGQVICENVSISPPNGNLIEVALADNNAAGKMPALGILNEDLDAAGGDNDEGDAIMFGKVSGIDTSAFEVGDEVFVSDTPGGLTTTKPTGVKYIQKVGVVIRDDNTNGTIEVFGAGRVNDVPTPLYIDHANQRLGIGAINPTQKLDIRDGELVFTSSNVNQNPSGRIRFNEYGTSQASGAYMDYDGVSNAFSMFTNDTVNDYEFLRANRNSHLLLQPNGNRVGIGTTSPSEKLVVRNGTSNTDVKILAYNSAAGTEATLKFSTIASETNYEKAAIIARNAEASWGRSDMHFALDSAEDSGNVEFADTKMTILNGGNVGIGETDPDSKLHIKTPTASSSDMLLLENYGWVANMTTGIAFKNGSNYQGQTAKIYTVMNGSGNQGGEIRFATLDYSATNPNPNTTLYDRMTIDDLGGVGIGTTSPDVKLEVESTTSASGIRIKNTNSGYASLDVESNRSTGDNLGGLRYRKTGQANSQAEINYVSNVRFDFLSGSGTSAPTQKLSILNNGSVGIGINNPSELLHLRSTGPARLLIEADSDNITETDNAQIILKQDGGAVVGNLGYKTNTNSLEITNNYAAADGILTFGTRGAERMRVSDLGNVGIGTTNPLFKLDLGVNAINLNTATNKQIVLNVNGGYTGQATDQYKVIGYTGSIASNADIFTQTSGENLKNFYTGVFGGSFFNSSRWGLVQGGSTRFCVLGGTAANGAGNIGINTTSPSEKLEVAGKVYIENQGVAWDTTTPGTTRGALHFDPVGNAANNTGNAITFGASDTGSGSTAQAGIYTRTDSTYGTRMYLATTDSYSAGSKTRMTIYSNGNVGIGSLTPGEKLDVAGNIKVSGEQYFNGTAMYGDGKEIIRYSDTWLRINPAQNFTNGIFCGSGILRTDGIFQVGPSGSKFVVNSIGNVGINGAPSTTTATKLKVYGTIASTGGLGFQIENAYGSPLLGDFYGNFATTAPLYVGSPYSTLACYAASFNVTSDYRLKENEAPLTKASSRIKKLKPIRFNYINSENTVDGFLAHEVAEVIPEAVTGEKDAIREDGSDELQGLDLSKIVPLLTAALQESITKIEKLEQRIQTLENK